MNAIAVCDDGDLPQGVAAARRLGIALEVQQFYDPVVADTPSAIQSALRTLDGLTPLAIHGPFGDLCPGSFDAMIRDATRQRFELGATVAARLAAQHVVFHHGYVPGTSPPANWLRRCSAFWKAFLADKPASTHFHMENMVEHGPELLRDVIDAIEAPNVTACLDIGHAHCHSHATPLKWVEALGARIGYVHIHNNYGEADDHLAPANGTLDVAEVLMAMKECSPAAIWALEVPLSTIDGSMEWLRNVLARG